MARASTVLVSLFALSLQSRLAFALSPRFVATAHRNVSSIKTTTRRMTTADANEGSGLKDIGQSAEDQDASGELKSWRTLMGISSAKTRKIRGSNYVQLATIDSNGKPRCRTVVFRGFLKLPEDHFLTNACDGESCIMKMITDYRSRKVEHVSKHESSAAELVWWFPKTTEQYRVTGKIVFIGNGQFEHDSDKALATARKEMWGNMSDSAREQFFDANTPGVSYTGAPENIPTGGRDEEGKLLLPPDDFLLMLLVPEEVDYLRLQNMYRQVDTYDGKWETQRLNP